MDTLTRNGCQIASEGFPTSFTSAVRCLAQQRVFPARVTLALHPGDLVTSSRFDSASVITRLQTIHGRNGRMTPVPTRVHDCRSVVLMQTHPRIPAAAKLLPIQEHRIAHWQEPIAPARANLALYAAVATTVTDCEFVHVRDHVVGKGTRHGMCDPWQDDHECDERSIPRMQQAHMGARTFAPFLPCGTSVPPGNENACACLPRLAATKPCSSTFV